MVDPTPITRHVKYHHHHGGHKPHAPDSTNVSSAADDVVDGVKQVGNGSSVQWGNIAIAGPWVVTPVARGVTNAAAKIGKFTGFEPLEKWGTSANKRVIELSEKTISDAAQHIPGSRTVGQVAANASSFAGEKIQVAADATGISKYAPKWSAMRAQSHYGKLQTQLDGIAVHEGNLPAPLQEHFRAIVDNARKPLGQIDADKLAADANEMFSKADGLKLAEHEKDALKAAKGIIKTASKAATSQGNAVSLGNIGAVVKELPQGIAKSAVIPGVMNTAFIGMSAVGMYSVAKGFSQNLDSLKEMYADITGKKVSTIGILTGSVPKPIAEARTKLMENFGVSELTGLAGLAVSVIMASRGKLGLVGAVAPALAGTAAGAIIGDSALSYYSGMKAAYAAGQKLSTDDYALLIGKASSDLKLRGEDKGAFAKKLAGMYANENISPQQVMQEVSNGDLKKRIELLIKENEAAKNAAPVAPVAEVPQKSHVAALQEGYTKPDITKKEQPVIGDHTSKLVADAVNASREMGGA